MKVSIAIPTFEYYGKGVEVLDDMFRTISHQTLKDVQLVVSDHSVNDDIQDYCNLNQYNLNIKYIRNENDRGDPASNTNNAIDNSDGEIIKIFQQDDFFYDTESLEKMYNEMTNSTKNWFVCGAIHTRDNGNTFFNPMYPRWDDKMIFENNHNFIGGVSVISIKNKVKTRFDSTTKILLDVDFYYGTMLEYGMPILYQDILIGNRCSGKESFTGELCEYDENNNMRYKQDIIDFEFSYVSKKYNLIK